MEKDNKEITRGNKIEVVRLIEFLQDEIDAAGKVPFSNKVMVDQQLLTQLIDEIIQSLPNDFSTAAYVISEKDRILDEANSEYNRIKQEAQEIMRTQVNEHVIVKEAENKAKEMIAQAQDRVNDLKAKSKIYVDDMLHELESQITERTNEAMNSFRMNMEQFVEGFNSTADQVIKKIRIDNKILNNPNYKPEEDEE